MSELNMRGVALQGIRDLVEGLESETRRLGEPQEREIRFDARELMCEAYGYGRGGARGSESSLLDIALDLERCSGVGVRWLREKSDGEVLVFLCRYRARRINT